MKRKREWKVKIQPENIIESKEFKDYVNYLHYLFLAKHLYEKELLTHSEYLKVVKAIEKGR